MTRKLRLTLSVDGDQYGRCPQDEWDGCWKLYSFNTSHINHLDPMMGEVEINGETVDVSVQRDGSTLSPALQKLFDEGLAYVCSYFEHGEGMWSIAGTGPQCRWDNVSVAGIQIWPHDPNDMGARTPEERAKDAATDLETYNKWMNGHVYGYNLDELKYCGECGQEELEDHLDSCYGHYDPDYMAKEIRAHIEEGDEVEVTGDASWLADHEDFVTPLPKEAANGVEQGC